MTILAVFGPVGSDFVAFSTKCYLMLNPESSLIIGCSKTSIDLVLSLIEGATGDVIIFGSDIFLEEELLFKEQRPSKVDILLSKVDIKVFLELDSDLCLSNHLKSAHENETDINKQIDHYLTVIRPLNDKIRESAYKISNMVRPQSASNDTLIDLLINKGKKILYPVKVASSDELIDPLIDKEEKTLHPVKAASSSTVLRDGFWKPEVHLKTSSDDEIILNDNSNLGL